MDKEKLLLFTIVSAESELQICSLINSAFSIKLSLTDDQTTSGFKKYLYEIEEDGEKYILIVNRIENKYLLSELKKIDYLFIIVTESILSNFERYLQQLRASHGISSLLNLDPGTLKSFHKIQF